MSAEQRSTAPSDEPAARIARALARRAADLPRADVGTWAGWHERPTPESYVAALAAYRADDLGATWALLCDVLDAAPDHPAALQLLGGVAFRLGRDGDAVEAYERFLVHAPEDVARTRHLGHAYHGLGRHAEARAHYQRVLAAEDLSAEARRETLFGRALAAYRDGDVAAASADLDAVLALAPDDVEALTWRATLDFDDEELDRAEAAARRATALAPHDPRPQFVLARVLAERLAIARASARVGDLGADAGAAIDGKRDRAGGTGTADVSRATLAVEAAAADERFRRLAALDARARNLEADLLLAPGNVDARLELLRVELAAEDTRGALRQATVLLQRAPQRGDAQVAVLQALEATGRLDTARRHASNLEAIFTADPAVLEAVAAFLGRQGDLQGRLRAGARAAELRAARDE